MEVPKQPRLRGPFGVGDRVLLFDRKGRRHLVTLEPAGEFHTHRGILRHADLVGHPDGSIVRSSRGAQYTAFRPTLADVVLKMPRGAQVIYPKDLGAILMLADIYPGARVLESGLGSGALSIALLRAGAQVVGYEIRDDFLRRARRNVTVALGEDVLDRYETDERDIYAGIEEVELDRVVLDLPEPWRVVGAAQTALIPGGLLLAYTPSIVQVTELRGALDRGPWSLSQTLEVLHRTWKVDGAAVRPDHRMVAHTAFLTCARLLADPSGEGRTATPHPAPR